MRAGELELASRCGDSRHSRACDFDVSLADEPWRHAETAVSASVRCVTRSADDLTDVERVRIAATTSLSTSPLSAPLGGVAHRSRAAWNHFRIPQSAALAGVTGSAT